MAERLAEHQLSLKDAIALGIAEREKPTLQQRLFSAAGERLGGKKGKLVVVSNRNNSSHALLRLMEDGGLEVTWVEIVHRGESYQDYFGQLPRKFLFTGQITYSPAGEYQSGETYRIDDQSFSQRLGNFENTGGFYFEPWMDFIDIPFKPVERFPLLRDSDSKNDYYEIPLNTVTLLAEHGQVNHDLTQAALFLANLEAVSPRI